MLRFGRAGDYVWAGIGLGLACATKYTGGIVLAAAAGGGRRAVHRARRARGRRARHRDRRRRGARRVPRRQPLRAAELRRLLERADAPVRRLRRRGRQARADAGQRLRLLPVVLRLGPGLGAPGARRRRRRAAVVRRAPAGLGARPGGRAVRAVHGLAGALLRPLADAGLPARLHPRGLRGVRARRLGRALQARAQADARRRGGRRGVRAGLRLLAALGPGPVARRHAQPDPRLDGRQRPGRHEDRRRARRARPMGAGHRQPVAADRPTAIAGTSSR